jgi:rare lipoprotein A
MASYFTSSMDGSPTASGEPANSGDLVAAHASYPLGSRVLVTNLANGKSVEVRIVDRIPKGPRVINLSESAARQLDFVKAGTAEVSLQPVQK